MENIAKLYGEAYKRYGRSPASLLFPKGRQYERFSALTRTMRSGGFSVLDFGCGFGDLKHFLDDRFHDVRYSGVDVTPEFINNCAEIHQGKGDFRLIREYTEIDGSFDYTIVAGTFNVLYHDERERHWDIVKGILRHLFSRTRRLLAFDLMTDQVDFTSVGAFHQSPMEVHRFVSSELSRRLFIDQSYMPYEFAVLVYKDAEIQRPSNLYRQE